MGRARDETKGSVEAVEQSSFVLETVMSTAPLIGFSFPAEYATEYQAALDEA